ncbi:unnamed protein product [Prorocentrum cordatum]|uniref:Uncharacterized protein n=1 Tax=Prorocentrum cordatum TaxID=2364126 RepID=A0ABN9QXM3_9DINO|nr:unnamed protein product [Polarella glacialis]
MQQPPATQQPPAAQQPLAADAAAAGGVAEEWKDEGEPIRSGDVRQDPFDGAFQSFEDFKQKYLTRGLVQAGPAADVALEQSWRAARAATPAEAARARGAARAPAAAASGRGGARAPAAAVSAPGGVRAPAAAAARAGAGPAEVAQLSPERVCEGDAQREGCARSSQARRSHEEWDKWAAEKMAEDRLAWWGCSPSVHSHLHGLSDAILQGFSPTLFLSGATSTGRKAAAIIASESSTLATDQPARRSIGSEGCNAGSSMKLLPESMSSGQRVPDTAARSELVCARSPEAVLRTAREFQRLPEHGRLTVFGQHKAQLAQAVHELAPDGPELRDDVEAGPERLRRDVIDDVAKEPGCWERCAFLMAFRLAGSGPIVVRSNCQAVLGLAAAPSAATAHSALRLPRGRPPRGAGHAASGHQRRRRVSLRRPRRAALFYSVACEFSTAMRIAASAVLLAPPAAHAARTSGLLVRGAFRAPADDAALPRASGLVLRGFPAAARAAANASAPRAPAELSARPLLAAARAAANASADASAPLGGPPARAAPLAASGGAAAARAAADAARLGSAPGPERPAPDGAAHAVRGAARGQGAGAEGARRPAARAEGPAADGGAQGVAGGAAAAEEALATEIAEDVAGPAVRGRPGARRGAPPWLDAFEASEAARWRSLPPVQLAQDLLRRLRYQDEATMVLLLLAYLVALAFSASIAYRQASNESPVTYYADPRSHQIVAEGHELPDFLEAFGQPPREVHLEVTGLVPMFMLPNFLTEASVEWLGSRYAVAFSFALDLAPWVRPVPRTAGHGDTGATDGPETGITPATGHTGVLPGLQRERPRHRGAPQGGGVARLGGARDQHQVPHSPTRLRWNCAGQEAPRGAYDHLQESTLGQLHAW